jgi:hypothetical protein
MKISLPTSYQIQTTKEFSTTTPKPPKYIQSDSLQGGFLLEDHELWAYQKDQTPVQLGTDILDIDFDDNMLLSLTISGEVIVWQGDLHEYCTPENVQEFSRLLFSIPDFVHVVETNYTICFKGSVGLICILTSFGSLYLIKVDIDLSISLDYNTAIPLVASEKIETCAIWGDEIMYLVFTQTNQVFVAMLIDLSNPNSPCSEVLRSPSSFPITCLCHESKEISIYGDSNGGITLWNIYSDTLIDKVLTVHSFIPSAVTSLHLMAHENVVWIGGSDGTIVSSFINIQKENPIVLKLSILRLHSLSSYSTFLRWYPSDAPELSGFRLLSNAQRGERESISSGAILTICSVTGEVSSTKLSPFLDSIITTNPFPSTVWTIPPSAAVGYHGIPFPICYQSNIDLVLYLPYQHLLLICTPSCRIDVWNPITSEFCQSIDLMESPMRSLLLEGKITTITLLNEEIQSVESDEIGQREEECIGSILIGLITGSVWTLELRRRVYALPGNNGRAGEGVLKSQNHNNTNRYSVLDMMESLSVIQNSNLLDEHDRDGIGAGPESRDHHLSQKILEEDSLLTRSENQLSSLLYQVTCTRIDSHTSTIPQSGRKQTHLDRLFLFPPIPVTDIFVSSKKSILCVIHSRCSFSIYSLTSSQMIRTINLNPSDSVVDICSSSNTSTSKMPSTSVSLDKDEDTLIIGILGKEKLMILDVINGSHLYAIMVQDLPMIPSTETILFSQIISLGSLSNTTGDTTCPHNNRAMILLTTAGNLYFFHNFSNPRPIQLFASESILFHDGDEGTSHDHDVDHLSSVPLRIDYYPFPMLNSRSLLIIQTFRILIFLIIDSTKHPHHPQISKLSKIEFKTTPTQRRRVLSSYPIELDWKNEMYRILVVMSDGSTFIVTV